MLLWARSVSAGTYFGYVSTGSGFRLVVSLLSGTRRLRADEGAGGEVFDFVLSVLYCGGKCRVVDRSVPRSCLGLLGGFLAGSS